MPLEDVLGIGIFVLIIAAYIYLSAKSSRKRRDQESGYRSPHPASGNVDVATPEPSLLNRFPPITAVLIVVSVAVSLLSNFGSSTAALTPLFIAEPESQGYHDIFTGEVWRLLTPIFIHFGAMHILFNMLWLWDLGANIERKKGGAFLVGFVLAVGIGANIAQYSIVGSPYFGGMSGVVYGLLAYVWISGKRNPHSGLALHQQTVIMMLGWYILCWTGLLGPIANWAHTAGLVLGLAIGFRKLKNG